MPELIPLGSVVTLKDGTKRIMIAGRLVKEEQTGKVYDYCAVLWPEGYLDAGHTFLFDHGQIDKLYHIGLQDTQEFQWRHELDRQYQKCK